MYDDYSIWPIHHSEWSGWTTADQVFPNFLFIMGIAIPFAIKLEEEITK
jgi:predicted acyltransferase